MVNIGAGLMELLPGLGGSMTIGTSAATGANIWSKNGRSNQAAVGLMTGCTIGMTFTNIWRGSNGMTAGGTAGRFVDPVAAVINNGTGMDNQPR